MSKSDWDYFNCSEPHEHEYVVSLYNAADHATVRQFLKEKCTDGTIKNFTHKEVYDLIEKRLGIKRK